MGNWGEEDLGRVTGEESEREKGTLFCLPLAGSCLRFWAMEMGAGGGVDLVFRSGQRSRDSILQAQLP